MKLMKSLFHTVWNVLVHLFWSVVFYGQFVKSFDGILMLFGTRLSHAYSTWPNFSLSLILLFFMWLSIYMSKIAVKWFRQLGNSDFSSKSVDKS